MDSLVNERRRSLLAWWGGVVSLFLVSAIAGAQDQVPTPLPSSPGRRRNPNDPDDPAAGEPGVSRKAVLEQHQKDIKKDVEKLFTLAQDLKTEVEKTDATAVLSMAMLKKTEEIEKLAKQIRDRARG